MPENKKRLSEVRKKQYKNGFTGSLGHHWKKTPEQIANKIGKKNPEWKGDDVGYAGLHLWVKRHRGKPDVCEHCGRSGLSGRQIHWANKSHQYLRELDDWIRLCSSCHKKYDETWINRERNLKGQFI